MASNRKPSSGINYNTLKRSKIVPINVDQLEIQKQSRNFFDFVPEDLIQEIFEYLVNDYTSIRLVSWQFRQIYDNFIYRFTWQNFPNSSEKTFSYLKDETVELGTLEYKLIPLAKALFFNSNPLISYFKQAIDTSLLEDTDLRSQSSNIMYFFEKFKQNDIIADYYLILMSAFFKAGILDWNDVFQLLFSENFILIEIAWSLGLISFAREMSLNNTEIFNQSIQLSNFSIIDSIKGKHYTFSKFVIEWLCYNRFSFLSENTFYLDNILFELIKAEFWDLCEKIYDFIRSDHNHLGHGYSQFKHHLLEVAEQGSVEGLNIFVKVARIFPNKLAHLACIDGHVNFLKALESMKLLRTLYIDPVNGDTAVHVAAFHGQTECLKYFVNRFGVDCLKIENKSKFMLIHLAAGHSNNVEALQFIINCYPHYKSRFLFSTNEEISSPLIGAVSFGNLDNVKVLLKAFPELIRIKYRSFNLSLNIIHYAVIQEQIDILEYLLKVAPSRIISAKLSSSGNTALHLAAETSNINLISMLVRTGKLSSMDRNCFGQTPVEIFSKSNRNKSSAALIEIFRLKSTAQLEMASISKNNCFFF